MVTRVSEQLSRMTAAAKIQLCESTPTALGHTHKHSSERLLGRNLVLFPSSAYWSSGQKHLLEVVPDSPSRADDGKIHPRAAPHAHPRGPGRVSPGRGSRSQIHPCAPPHARSGAAERLGPSRVSRAGGAARQPGWLWDRQRSGTDALAAGDPQPLPRHRLPLPPLTLRSSHAFSPWSISAPLPSPLHRALLTRQVCGDGPSDPASEPPFRLCGVWVSITLTDKEIKSLRRA